MLTIAVVMLVILAVCAVLVVYVAFPHRGEDLPAAPWLGDVMARAADAIPTIDADDADAAEDADVIAAEPLNGKHSRR